MKNDIGIYHKFPLVSYEPLSKTFVNQKCYKVTTQYEQFTLRNT